MRRNLLWTLAYVTEFTKDTCICDREFTKDTCICDKEFKGHLHI